MGFYSDKADTCIEQAIVGLECELLSYPKSYQFELSDAVFHLTKALESLETYDNLEEEDG